MASSSISTGSNNSAASKRSDDKSGNTLDGIFKIIALSSSVTVDGTVHDNVSTTNNLDNSSAATPRRNNSKYRINDDEEYQLQQQQQHGTKANECNEAQYDIPINLSSNQPERGNQSVPVHNAEISLPSSEELKAEGHLRQSHGSSLFYKVCYKHRQRTVMVSLSLLIIIIVSTIIGISIQLLYLRNNSNSENDMYHRKVDLQEVISYLTNTHDIQFFSDRTSNTPQYMAAKWMAETDPANWDLPTASTTTNDDNYAYRYLARFIMALNYYALNGQYWTNPLNFLSKQDICSWVGYVDGSTSSGGGSSNELAGIFCDIQTNLPIDVSLFYNGLSGKIPTENGLLTTLKIFDVKYNDIDGTIPSELCSLTSLTSLFLGYNEFYGTIPSCIGQLQNMLRIFWSNNNFDGAVPLSMSNMRSLERFIIDDNYFTGDTISSVLSTMTNLNMLMLNDNMLDGILDDTFLSNHPNLTILDLSHNNFALPPSQSSLPEHLFSMSALQVLDLSTNNMNGYLPSSISQINTNLQFVSLYGNKIKGSIPSGIANLQNLIHLDLSNNTLTGLIPTEIGDMKNLTYLFLSNNPWLSRGGVPTWVTNLTHLSNLSLRNTNRTGSLPDFINGTSMGQLILLDLGWNSFTGPIPSSFGSLDGLEFLLLNNNLGINGEMPDEFINATALRAIFLDGTNVRGTLDDTVCNLPNFVYLMDGYEENDIDGGGSVVYANCLGSTTLSGSKAITCSCCECCNAMRETGCSNPYLSNLDASWERNFKRVSYTFSNDTTFWDSSLYPNLV